jgi:AraC-like DNA-binding protein
MRQAVLKVGDLALVDTARPYALQFDEDFDQIVVRLPRRLITRRTSNAEPLTARVIAGDRGLGKLASTFLLQLSADRSEINPAFMPHLYETAIDLISTAVADESDMLQHLNEQHVRLRQRVVEYIDGNFSDPGLNRETIAAAHRVSVRHLNRIFENSESGLSEMIWERRLGQARLELADPLRNRLSVTDIAFGVGFKDVAHFSRSFKLTFGETPRAFRAKTRASLVSAS